MPDAPRSFVVPFVPLVPILGVAVCFYLMYSLPGESWLRLLAWMLLGVVIYFFYGKNKSKLKDI